MRSLLDIGLLYQLSAVPAATDCISACEKQLLLLLLTLTCSKASGALMHGQGKFKGDFAQQQSIHMVAHVKGLLVITPVITNITIQKISSSC